VFKVGLSTCGAIWKEETCADFRRNADEVFAGKPITVISTPKPNVGMWE
jgi:hypothetical protein